MADEREAIAGVFTVAAPTYGRPVQPDAGVHRSVEAGINRWIGWLGEFAGGLGRAEFLV